MMAARDGEFWVDSGTPFATALAAAREASERGDVDRMEQQYRRAVLLAPQASLRPVVAAEHVGKLRDLNDSATALRRCTEYLTEYGKNVQLLLLHAETELARGDFSRIDGELAEIRRIMDGQVLHSTEDALLNRLEGLAAARNGRFTHALRCLRRARDGYQAQGDNRALGVLDDDIRAVTARQGKGVPDPAVGTPNAAPQSRLTTAEELRLLGRYEEALGELNLALDGPLDPAMVFSFLEAKVRVLCLLRADADADDLMPSLEQAARSSAQPEQNEHAAQRLDRNRAVELSALAMSGRELQAVRRLVDAGRLDEADRVLRVEPTPAEPDARHAAEWHLAAGELTMAIADRDGTPTMNREAASHFQESARQAARGSLVTIEVAAKRLLGKAHAALGEMDRATEAWAAAHRIEEEVAALQWDQRFRIGMLSAAPDEFDERIRVAAEGLDGRDPRAAVVVVAMEAARGSAILPRILPSGESLVRDLPQPSDIAGARRWVRRAARGLPRSQVVWMMHATPDRIHHAFIRRASIGRAFVGRWTLRHVSVPCVRNDLISSIDALKHCWKSGDTLEMALATDPRSMTSEFDRRVRQVAEHMGIHELSPLPRRVRRIAVVAGGDLSEIPLAVLPCPGADKTLIGRRYALCDLPCLSLRHPLRRRSHGQRGTAALLLQGPDDPRFPNRKLTPAAPIPGRKDIHKERATPAALGEELASGRHRQVRIDSHGDYLGDPSQAAIHLAPWGPEGELRPEELESMRLGATGTLVLGACETGMAKRIGRDERTGFVRAALVAGTSAVLAARWQALNSVAAHVLDRFERYLRAYPRDVALFLAMRDEDTVDRSGEPRRARATATHPARWATWTLYGDPGYQTDRGPLPRLLQRMRNPARPSPSEPQ